MLKQSLNEFKNINKYRQTNSTQSTDDFKEACRDASSINDKAKSNINF